MENEAKRLVVSRWLLCLTLGLGGCGIFTDAATRIAYEIERKVGRLEKADGATLTIRHETPSKAGECGGPYRVQFDRAGALIVWCHDAEGNVVSSHSTSYHRRFVDTAETFIVEKPAGSVLLIQVTRRNGRAVITQVR